MEIGMIILLDKNNSLRTKKSSKETNTFNHKSRICNYYKNHDDKCKYNYIPNLNYDNYKDY